MRKGSIRYNHSKEYESNISYFRIKAGLTVEKLCELTNMGISMYVHLNTGQKAPVLRNGDTRPAAKALADFFEVSLAQLFPRYFCDNISIYNFTPQEIAEYFHSGIFSLEFSDPESILIEREKIELFHRMLFSWLDEREICILVYRYVYEFSLDQIGKKYDLSRERIRQILKEISRKLHKGVGNLPSDVKFALDIEEDITSDTLLSEYLKRHDDRLPLLQIREFEYT